MDFPAEASTSNRHHRLDRIRSKKSCRRSLQFSNGECLYQLFLHTSFNSGGNNSYHFLVSFGYIAADGTPATLPFDKPYIEALKGVHFLFYNKQKLPILPVMLFSNYLPLESYPDRSYYGGPTRVPLLWCCILVPRTRQECLCCCYKENRLQPLLQRRKDKF